MAVWGFFIGVMGLPWQLSGKEFTCHARDPVPSLGGEDPLENGMATHSSILAWRIPWSGEPGRLHGVTESQARLK